MVVEVEEKEAKRRREECVMTPTIEGLILVKCI